MSGGHAERAHALLGASKASQWINCPPSARLQDGIEESRSAFADEGTAAHEYSEMVMRRKLLPCDSKQRTQLDKAMKKFQTTSPHYSSEMENAVNWYVEEVAERLSMAKARTADAVMLLEEKLDFSEWVPEGFGTGDVVIVADGVLEIIDLKYGKGVPVYAENNSQMKLYALGAWTSYSYLYDIHTINMSIIQPRLDSISTDSISITDLLTWAETVVKPAAVLADKGEGEFKSGKHCQFCKVKGNCRARADENMALIAHEFKEPALLAMDEIGPILTIAENLQKWAKDVQEYAFKQAAAGQAVPGWKLVEGRSNRSISDKEEAMGRFARSPLDIGKYQKPIELLGITELEKRVGKKEIEALIGDLLAKPPGKPVLVVETDKRPVLNSLDGDFNGEDFDNE